jgi:hypothetical protein
MKFILTKKSAISKFADIVVDIVFKMGNLLLLAVWLTLAAFGVLSCSSGDPDPDEGNGGGSPVVNTIDKTSTPTQDASIPMDSVMLLESYATTYDFQGTLDLRKGAVGIPVNITYTGKNAAESMKSFKQKTRGFEALLNDPTDVQFIISRQDGKFIMQAESKNAENKVVILKSNTLEISKVQRAVMSFESAANTQNVVEQFGVFAPANRKILKGVLRDVKSAGVPNNIKANSTIYTLTN